MHTTRGLSRLRAFSMLFAVALLSGCFTAVDSTEHCIETRYGNVVNPKMSNGLTSTITTSATCFPLVDQNYPLDRGSAEEFEAQTADPVTIKGKVAVVFAYQDIAQLFADKRTPEAAQVQAINALKEALASATAQQNIGKLFGPGRVTFGDSVKAIAQRKLGTHIVIKQVFINNLHAPDQIEKARIAAAEKDQQLDAALKQLQIDSATSLGSRIKAEADAFRQRVESEAIASSPEVLKLRMAEAMANGLKGACSGASTCIIGGSVTDKFLAGFGTVVK